MSSTPEDVTRLEDRYDLEEIVGRGGMADVHRGTDRVLHRSVAIKVLRETAELESDRLRFTAEARMLAGLSHPGLVTVLDAGITSEQPYLVMEFVEGPTLRQRCAEAPLDPDLVADMGAQLADALAYAHAQGVVHRDVKPANVLLGAGGRVKLADFGIARLMGDAVHHTRTGHAIGTAAYLAPEQVRGDEVTPAVDVYALGLVLLEALTGERAYPGPPTEAALARLSRGPHLPGTLTPTWRRLLESMTAREPSERLSAAEVATELRIETTGTMLLAAEEPDVRRAGFLTQFTLAGEALPAHVRGVTAAVAATVGLVVIAGLVAGGGATAGDEGRRPPVQPAHSSSTPSDAASTPLRTPGPSPTVEPIQAPVHRPANRHRPKAKAGHGAKKHH